MRVFNADKTQELEVYDLSKGYLVDDTIVTGTAESTPEVLEQGHYETTSEYPNGGKDVEWVVDVPYRPASDSRDIIEEIQVYIPYTPEEILWATRKKLITWLSDNNYKTIHHQNEIEGWLSGDTKYESYKASYQQTKSELDAVNEQIKEITGKDPDR